MKKNKKRKVIGKKLNAKRVWLVPTLFAAIVVLALVFSVVLEISSNNNFHITGYQVQDEALTWGSDTSSDKVSEQVKNVVKKIAVKDEPIDWGHEKDRRGALGTVWSGILNFFGFDSLVYDTLLSVDWSSIVKWIFGFLIGIVVVVSANILKTFESAKDDHYLKALAAGTTFWLCGVFWFIFAAIPVIRLLTLIPLFIWIYKVLSKKDANGKLIAMAAFWPAAFFPFELWPVTGLAIAAIIVIPNLIASYAIKTTAIGYNKVKAAVQRRIIREKAEEETLEELMKKSPGKIFEGDYGEI